MDREEIKQSISIIFDLNLQSSLAYYKENVIGECEFSVFENKWIIEHTGVREEYQGLGIAKQLVECVVKEARKRNTKILPICSYARKIMIGNDEFKDVLVEE